MMSLSVALTVLTLASVAPTDSLMAPGVSRALARYRAERIRDVRYDLLLTVNESDTARGRVVLRFSRTRDGDAILDFRGLGVGRTRVNGRPAELEHGGGHLRIPARLLRTGVNRVELDYTARVAAAGASIIRVRDPADGRVYLYTLLVPSDAQQLFPGFDQPDLKARFALTLVTPKEWVAVSNGRRLRSDTTSRGVAHVFRESEPISTYLFAFAAGPWAQKRAQGTRKPITLYVRQSRAQEVDADSIMSANDRAATWLEEYFSTPFPFQKLDMVLAPAFPFGGMEHPGAIFYSEERFVFRERPTQTQLLGRQATIFHEVAHQWFGDLVTMTWFDDLWLKEGFATYMAARMQDALTPGSEAWKTFYLRNKPTAYAVDGSEGTTPVWQELANLDQAKSNYGAIVYNKAPSILKQLNYLVGEQEFRSGLQRFLKRHAYDNATWRDLLSAIGSVSNRNLSSWGNAYILRPGMPVLRQHLELADAKVARFAVVQQPARALSGKDPWPIRTELVAAFETGEPLRVSLTLTGDTTWVPELEGRPRPRFVFANANDYAYATVLLDPASTATVLRDVGKVEDAFLRAMLWGALWDLVRSAVLAPDRFVVAALRELPAERDEQIASALLGRVARATTAYLGPVQRAALLPDVERTLMGVANDSRRSYGIRKAHLDTYIRTAGSTTGRAVLESFLDSTAVAGDSLRRPTRWSIITRLIALGVPSADAHLRTESESDRTAEGARRAFVAAAARPDPQVKREYFRRYFHDPELNEDWATSSLDAFNDLDAQVMTRGFLEPALDSLKWIQGNRRIFYLGSWIGAFLEGQSDPEALDIVRRWLDRNSGLSTDLRGKVKQALDELERTVRIRGAAGASISTGRPVPQNPASAWQIERPYKVAGTPRSHAVR